MRAENREITIFESAARTTSQTGPDMRNRFARGVVLTIDATASAATPSVVFTIQGKSTLGSDYYTILASAAITGASTTILRVYPGMTAAANTVANDVLPLYWRVITTAGDADSLTYSVNANLIV